MERRKVLKNLMIGVGGMLSLPAWANGWNAATFADLSLGNDLLADLVDTIIPETDTIGAKKLGVHQFVQLMIKDCYNVQDQTIFENGMKKLNDYAKGAFSTLSQPQRLAILEDFSNSAQENDKKFIKLVKDLTVWGYTSSEFFMTKYTDYEMAPARYLGCVPVK